MILLIFFTRHLIATMVTEAVSQAYEDLHKSPKVVGKHIQLRTTATEFLALHLDFPNNCQAFFHTLCEKTY